MPISRQARIMRRAISPRLAIRIFENMHCRATPASPFSSRRRATQASPLQSAGFYEEEYLPKFHRCTILHQNLRDRPAAFGLDVVENLHRFDHANVGFFIDGGTDGDKGFGLGTWRCIEGANHRALDGDQTG